MKNSLFSFRSGQDGATERKVSGAYGLYTPWRMKNVRTCIQAISIITVLMFISAANLRAQVVSGPSTAAVGEQTVYMWSSYASYGDPYWTLSAGGTVISETVVVPDYTFTIKWTSGGTHEVRFINGTTVLGSKLVTVTDHRPSVPGTTFNISTNCTAGTASVTRNTNPPANVAWFWQTSATGTSETLGSSSPLALTTASFDGNYYLRAKSLVAPVGADAWSATAQLVGNIVVAQTPPAPSVAHHAERKGPGPITISIDATAVSATYKWYSQNAPGGTPDVQQGLTYTFPNLAVTTTRWASAADGPCESTRLPVTATILPDPVIAAVGSDILTGPTVTLTVQPFVSYLWRFYDGTPVGTTQNVNVSQPGYYTVEVSDGAGSSVSAPFLVKDALESQVNDNFTVTTYITRAGVKDEAAVYGLTKNERMRHIEYLDDGGRTRQSVTMEASPAGYDIKVPFEYDNISRPKTEYLPMVNGQKDGRFDPGVLGTGAYAQSAHANFYTVSSQNNVGVPRDAKPFRTGVYEASPLDRINEMGGMGAKWQPDGLAASVSRAANTLADNVRRWTLVSNVPVASQVWPANLLAIETVTDVDDATATTTAARKSWYTPEGQLILERVKRIGVTPEEWVETYYVYDSEGNIIVMMPPGLMNELGASGNPTPSQLDRWAYQYRYDGLGRKIGEKRPGAGWTQTVFDKLDRPVLMQDALQASRNEWAFVKYDELGRPVLTGLYKPSVTYTRDQLQITVDGLNSGRGFSITRAPEYDVAQIQTGTNVTLQTAHTDGNTREYQATASISLKPGFSLAAGVGLELTLSIGNGAVPASSAFPDRDDENLTMTYYDSYGFGGKNFVAPDYNFVAETWTVTAGVEPFESVTTVRGLPTRSRQRVLGSPTVIWLNTVTHYDRRLRPIQILQQNHLGGFDRTSYRLGFSGQVLEKIVTHTDALPAVADQRIAERYEYDHAGRMTRAYHKVNTSPEVLLTELVYNQLGDMMTKRLHSTNNGTSFLQSLDYDRNIKGWATHINKTADAEGTPDYFSLELAYDTQLESGNTVRKDGLVSSFAWKDNRGDKKQFYNFGYDPQKYLSDAVYKTNDLELDFTDKFSEKEIQYDRNGNITGLKRYNDGLIDQLSYNYGAGATTGNQLRAVTDAHPGTDGFSELNTVGDDYTYDANGNLIEDKNKGITLITYTIRNQPEQITFGDGTYLKFLYATDGTQLQQTFYSASHQVNFKIDNVNEYVYRNDALVQLLTTEGHVAIADGSPEYFYYLADHVGSARVILRTETSNYFVKATMETANATQESQQFMFYDEAVKINSDIFDKTYDGTTGPTYYSTRLTGASGHIYGLARSISVMPGDVIDLEVYAKYLDPVSSNWTPAMTAFMGAIAGGTAAPGTFIDGGASGSIGSQTFPFPGQVTREDDSGVGPKAYLNYILFDRDFNYITSGFQRLSENAAENGSNIAHERLAIEGIVVEQAGYLYTYLSNENETAIEVYFDDFKITHQESNVNQINGYYPYGGIAYSYVRENEEAINAYFQGKEVNDLLKMHDFHARYYDAALGRWFNLDPKNQFFSGYGAMGNNPVLTVDPDGEFGWFIFAAAAAYLLFTEDGYDLQKMISPVAVHISLPLGTHSNGIGVDVSVGVPQMLPISYRYDVGVSYFWSRPGGYGRGFQVRNGAEWAILGGTIQYGGTRYRDYDKNGKKVADQVVHTAQIGTFFFNVSYTNDTEDSFRFMAKIPLIPDLRDGVDGYGSDRYRTASGRVKLGPFQLGFFLHTGEPTEVDAIGRYRQFSGGSINDPDRSNGIIYIGIGPLKIGYDSEQWRHFMQNRVAHDQFNFYPQYGHTYPWVRKTDRRGRFVFQFGSF